MASKVRCIAQHKGARHSPLSYGSLYPGNSLKLSSPDLGSLRIEHAWVNCSFQRLHLVSCAMDVLLHFITPQALLKVTYHMAFE